MTLERCILVVDDDADIRESVVDALSDEGYRVAGASDGGEALRLLRVEKLRPALILLDVMMPGMDGAAFRDAQLKDPELAGIPVVVFTANGSASDTALRLQADGYLKKPAPLDDLLTVVDRTAGGGA